MIGIKSFFQCSGVLKTQVVRPCSVKRYLVSHSWQLAAPNLDVEYICNECNVKEIEGNISRRKGIGDIKLIHSLKNKLETLDVSDPTYKSLEETFRKELLKIPNKTHPDISSDGAAAIIKTLGTKKMFDHDPLDFHDITKRLKLVRMEHLGNLSGSRSYFLLGEMAELEQAITRYALSFLFKENFKLISVPDILPRSIIESCGMNTRGERAQVYSLDAEMHGEDLCLSGTSEMALAGYLAGKTLNSDQLPLKLAAVSRCYRAEVSNTAEERGIYRVHEFTKVEMFIVSHPDKSEEELQIIRNIEERYFESLGLYFKILDMPPHELGPPAYRKYDIEAWLPGRKLYGELSSCSNCTDFQSRRLNIKYKQNEQEYFCHTLNGTACAVPRLLIALVETGQNKNGTIDIPEVLQTYMNNKTHIRKQNQIPPLKFIKFK